MTRIAIVGSRAYPLLYLVPEHVAMLRAGDVVISGGARGPDSIAVDVAQSRGLETVVFPADWSAGLGAGFARNSRIVEACDEVVAFWDGRSRGTLDTMRKARSAGKHVLCFGPDGRVCERF